MALLKQISWLHTNLPYPLLRLWGSSDRVVALTRKIAYGEDGRLGKYRLLKEMEKWPLDKLYEWQYAKLRKLLEHAYANVPFYRELWDKSGVKPSDIKSLDDINKLPVITKDDLFENEKDFFAKGTNPRRLLLRTTSGTTGRPGRFYYDKNTVAAVWGANLYIRNMMGYMPGKDKVLRAAIFEKEINMLTSDHLRFSHYSPLLRCALFPPRPVNEESFKAYLGCIGRHGIRHIEGYASILYAFSEYIERASINLQVDTIRTGAEVLYDFQREKIGSFLGGEVFNGYGTAEGIIRGNECHMHDGLHILPFGVGEVLGRGFSGKGEFVMTGLENHAFPLIRYNIKDVVKLSKVKCACGRCFPRIMEIEGRENDFIILPDGEKIHPAQFSWLIVTIPRIKDIFFLQHEDFHIDVLVVAEKEADKKQIRERLETEMRTIIQGRTNSSIIFKDSIERKGRKYTRIKTKVAW